MMKNIIETLLNLLFPPKCQVCGCIGEKALCAECQSKIKLINRREGNVFLCASYEGIMKKAIKRLKFRGKTSLAAVLGDIMSKNIPPGEFDCIIPVPLHKNRFKERGFNQSELLARAISKRYDIPLYTDVLLRDKETKHQFDLSREERFRNVQGAFDIKMNEKISGQRILVVDDIYTTGATINESSRLLYLNGAKKVYAACLSRADPCMI